LDNVLANLTGQLADMILDINAQFSSVTVKVDGIADNAAAIDAISTSIAVNEVLINANSVKLDANGEAIDNNGDGIDAISTSIESNQAEALVWYMNKMAAIDANGLRSDQNGNAIAVNEVLINDNAARIDANGDAIDGNGDKIDANGVKIDANGVKIDANGDGIADNGTRIDEISTYIESNQAAELVWYLNTMTGIGRVEVDIANNGAEIVAAQTAIIAEIMSVQQQSIANLLEISEIQQTQATILMYLNSLEASIQALQADVTTLLGD
jgi:hypothetical protein